jgi:NAD(P)-dependent dehydrogenase (short-subunit alcohol dehydrogenase family)
MRTLISHLRLSRRLPIDLAGKSVLVTGAGKGIGRALVDEMVRRGARVTMLDADAEALAAAAAELPADVFPVVVDVREREAMRRAVERTTAHFGSIDVVVANAGVAPSPATLRTISPDDYDRVIAINQTGVFNTIQPAIEPIIASRGHIVVVASVAAMLPGPGGAPYMVSKAGVEQLGRTLRIELAAHRASAGVAYFGIVDTAMTRATLDDDPLGQAGENLLPRPLRRRITAAQAAAVLADGIARRATRTLAPKSWIPVAALRGLIGLADGIVAANPRTRRLLIELEGRAARTTSAKRSD